MWGYGRGIGDAGEETSAWRVRKAGIAVEERRVRGEVGGWEGGELSVVVY